jgi:hypothetical protein
MGCYECGGTGDGLVESEGALEEIEVKIVKYNGAYGP